MTPETIRSDARGSTPSVSRVDAIGSVERFAAASEAVARQARVLADGISRRVLTMGVGCPRTRGSSIGDIPAAWELKSIGEIARFASGRMKPKDASRVPSPSRGIPIFSGKGLIGFGGSSLRRGATIVVGRVGTRCGCVHFVSDSACWITDSALFVYESRPEVDMRFLYHSLRRLDLPSLRSTGRQPLISLSTVHSLLLALPPLEEQREICDFLSEVESFQEIQEKVVAQAALLRSALAGHAAGAAEPAKAGREDLSTPRGA